MNIYSTSTTRFWTETHSDGLHMVDEIDDEDFGLKSEVHYIISPETVTKHFSITSQNDFFELCRKSGPEGMVDFFNELPSYDTAIYGGGRDHFTGPVACYDTFIQLRKKEAGAEIQ